MVPPTRILVQVEQLNGICSLSSLVQQKRWYWASRSPTVSLEEVAELNETHEFRVHFLRGRFVSVRNQLGKFAEVSPQLEFVASSAEELELLPYVPVRMAGGPPARA